MTAGVFFATLIVSSRNAEISVTGMKIFHYHTNSQHSSRIIGTKILRQKSSLLKNGGQNGIIFVLCFYFRSIRISFNGKVARKKNGNENAVFPGHRRVACIAGV